MAKKILFVYTNYSTFVKTDFEILSEAHSVTRYQFKPVKGLIKTSWQMLRQLFFLLFNLWKFDVVFVWFADYHSILPVLFAKVMGKKSFVVIGGYDVARMPELNYGVFTSKIRGFCAAFSMRKSYSNLAVSRYVERRVRKISHGNKTKLIYNCVNIKNSDVTDFNKENLIITVGLIDSKRSFILKGIDTFIETAKLLPEIQFMIIGMGHEIQKAILPEKPDNLEIVGLVKHEDLVSYYKKAKVYCQLSRSESFGVAVVEAMSFGCVPIVTNLGGLPELIEKSGKIVKRNAEDISFQTSEIIKRDPKSFDQKKFLNPSFSFEKRKSEIRRLFS